MIMMIIIIIIIFSLSNGELMMMVATWWFYFLASEFVSVCVWNSHTQRLQFFNFFSEQKYWLTEPIKKLRVTSKIIKMMIENGEKREKKKSIKWLTLLSFNDDNVIIIGQQAKLWKIYENFWQKKIFLEIIIKRKDFFFFSLSFLFRYFPSSSSLKLYVSKLVSQIQQVHIHSTFQHIEQYGWFVIWVKFIHNSFISFIH